jgi:transposase-like protein
MRPEIPQALKRTVIQLYLQGVSRNEIASRTGISQESVSNITMEWKTGLGYPDPDDLRDLGVILKNAGMTAPQCTMGLRIAQIMKSLGIEEENFRTFISEIYQHCTEIGLRPQKVAENVKQLLELSESIPLWQIPQYISDKKSEKRELEEDILRLKQQDSQARCSFELALRTTNVSSKQLNDFCELRASLEKTGISLDDIEPFAKTIEGVKKLGYDAKRLARLMSNFQALSMMQAELEMSVNSQMSKLKNLTDECDRLETLLRIHNQYRELEDIGFGLPQLRIVQDTIHEVARANNISNYLAVEKFLNDILENYEPKSGHGRKIHALRSETEKKKSDLIVLTTASKKEVAKVLGQLVSTAWPTFCLPVSLIRAGEYRPFLRKEDLEDILEMQKSAFARNSSNSRARGS